MMMFMPKLGKYFAAVTVIAGNYQ